MWQPSYETAVSLYGKANIFLIGALVVGAIATVLVVWMGNIKEEYLKRDIAAANERAAEATLKAENERLERLKLEAVIAPRSLSIEQQNALADALRPFAGEKVIIASPPMDGEALGIAQQIFGALTTARTPPINMIGRISSMGGFAFGIHIAGRNADLVKVLKTVFASFGQLVDANDKNAALPLLTYPGGDFPDAKSAAAAIFVGTKPVPLMK